MLDGTSAPAVDDEPIVTDEPVLEPTAGPDDQPIDASHLPEGYQVHVVVSGDSLWAIAETYGTTVDAIVAANDLANPADLDIDQEIIIPPPTAEVTTEGDSSSAEEDFVPPEGE